MTDPDLEAIERRWHTYHDRSADDYTDAGCRVLAEHAFTDVAALLSAIRERDRRIVELNAELVEQRAGHHLCERAADKIEDQLRSQITYLVEALRPFAEAWEKAGRTPLTDYLDGIEGQHYEHAAEVLRSMSGRSLKKGDPIEFRDASEVWHDGIATSDADTPSLTFVKEQQPSSHQPATPEQRIKDMQEVFDWMKEHCPNMIVVGPRRSQCCSSPLRVGGQINSTRYYVCDECGKPSDSKQ